VLVDENPDASNIPRRSTYITPATVAKLTVFGALRLLFPSLASPSSSETDFRSPPKKELNMPIGTVKFFDTAKGYGFITNEAGGSDAFVHISAVEAAGLGSLEKEQRLSYELQNDQRGKTSAVNLQSA
jgi:CspA family cold shock protein